MGKQVRARKKCGRLVRPRAGICAVCCLLVLALAACGRSGLDLVFDDTVPSDQRSLLEKDISRLGSMDMGIDVEGAAVLGISNFSQGALKDWLARRTHYIVGEDYDLDANTVRVRDLRRGSPFEASRVITVMSNVGSAVYLAGVKESAVYALRINGEQVTVSSPRVNAFQIGEGLFTDVVTGHEVDDFSSSLLRLTTLFHEARHTDGHGTYTAMPHALCTSGAYAQHYACESFLNGPYAVGATILSKFYQYTTDCDDDELEYMRLSMTDYQSRILPDAKMVDDSPEGL